MGRERQSSHTYIPIGAKESAAFCILHSDPPRLCETAKMCADKMATFFFGWFQSVDDRIL